MRVERSLQAAARRVQSRVDRAHGDVELSGDLGAAEALDLEHGEYSPVIGLELAQGTQNRRAEAALGEGRAAVGWCDNLTLRAFRTSTVLDS